jgi:hypothetical protein
MFDTSPQAMSERILELRRERDAARTSLAESVRVSEALEVQYRERVAELERERDDAIATGIAEACRIFKAQFRPPRDLDALDEKLAENRPVVMVAQLLEMTTGRAKAVVQMIRDDATATALERVRALEAGLRDARAWIAGSEGEDFDSAVAEIRDIDAILADATPAAPASITTREPTFAEALAALDASLDASAREYKRAFGVDIESPEAMPFPAAPVAVQGAGENTAETPSDRVTTGGWYPTEDEVKRFNAARLCAHGYFPCEECSTCHAPTQPTGKRTDGVTAELEADSALLRKIADAWREGFTKVAIQHIWEAQERFTERAAAGEETGEC